MIGRFYLMVWCCYGYTILGGLDGEVSFLIIFSRDINASLCVFTSVTSGLAGAEFFIERIKSCAA